MRPPIIATYLRENKLVTLLAILHYRTRGQGAPCRLLETMLRSAEGGDHRADWRDAARSLR